MAGRATMVEGIGLRGRYDGIDIAKALAIFLVVLHHIFDLGCGVTWCGSKLGLVWTHVVLFGINYSCIDLFVLITGWLCVNSRCRLSRLLSLWAAAIFWGVSVLAILDYGVGLPIRMADYGRALLPVLNEQYWFFNAYFLLFIFMPILNSALHGLSRTTLWRVLICLIVVIGCGSWIRYHDVFRMERGYSFAWFCVVYLLGGYVRLHCQEWRVNPIICFGMALGTAVGTLGVEIIKNKCPFISLSLISYVSPVTLGIALMLFLGCLNLHLVKWLRGIVGLCAASTFGIYLIHVQPCFFEHVWRANLRRIEIVSPIQIIYGFLFAIMLVVLLSAAEQLRQMVFKVVGLNKLLEKIDR